MTVQAYVLVYVQVTDALERTGEWPLHKAPLVLSPRLRFEGFPRKHVFHSLTGRSNSSMSEDFPGSQDWAEGRDDSPRGSLSHREGYIFIYSN